MVPRVYGEVKDFIVSCVKFSEDLNLSQAEIDETVRKSTNILLTRTLSGCLSSLIRRDNLSLLQLIQIDINTYHLEETNLHLEKYISEITGLNSFGFLFIVTVVMSKIKIVNSYLIKRSRLSFSANDKKIAKMQI